MNNKTLSEIAEDACEAGYEWARAKSEYDLAERQLKVVYAELTLINRGDKTSWQEADLRTLQNKRYIQLIEDLRDKQEEQLKCRITYEKMQNLFSAKQMELAIERDVKRKIL